MTASCYHLLFLLQVTPATAAANKGINLSPVDDKALVVAAADALHFAAAVVFGRIATKH